MKRITLTFLLVGIVSLVTAGIWARAATRARARTAMERRMQQDLAATLRRLQAEIDAGRHTINEVPAQQESQPTQASKPATKRDSGWKAPDTMAAEREEPRLQLLQAAAQRARTRGRYAPLFRRLCLSPAQIEQFETAMAARNERSSDLWAALREQGLTFDGPEARKANTAIYQDYVAAETAVLGAAGFQQLEGYENTLEVRNMSAALAGAAAMRGAPLNPEQAEQLAQTLASCSEQYAAHRGGAMPQDVDWNRAALLSQAFLTPAQHEIVMNLAANGPDGVMGRRLSELHATINKAVDVDGRTTRAE